MPDSHQEKLDGLGKILGSVLRSAGRAAFILLCPRMEEAALTPAAVRPCHRALCRDLARRREEAMGKRTRGNQGTCFWLEQLTAPAPS